MSSDSLPTDPRRRLGNWGETLAVRKLEETGLIIVERNWRCTVGEIDIVARELAPDYVNGGASVPWLVFVEVRTRRGVTFGTALQSVTPRKQAKLREVCSYYLQTSGWPGPWRIDVVAVQMDSNGRLRDVEHLRHAVTG